MEEPRAVEDLCARGEVLCTEPGRPHPCPAGHAGPAHEGKSRTMSMHADEESDEGVVPVKRSNNEGLSSAEDRGGKDLARGERRADGRGPDTPPGARAE